MSSKYTALFEPLKVGALTLPNRFIMAPLTRIRAGEKHIANAMMAEHYAQRATAGLLIAEATMIQENQSAFFQEPGIYNQECIEGWKLTTKAVHDKGGRIILQIWHGGRACFPPNSNGTPNVSSTDRACSHTILAPFCSTGEKSPYHVPVRIEDADIPKYVDLYRVAARNAMEAGFDGVEIHGANGYLIDQFLKDSCNDRTGPYGGSMENRCRFALEVVDACAKEIGADRVGIRLSPLNSYNDMKDSDPIALTIHLAKELDKRGIAFIHIMRTDFFGIQKGDVVTPVRENFKSGAVISNMGYELDEAEAAIASKAVDAIAFGTKFLANPDLVKRAEIGAALNVPNQATFYLHNTAEGYNDYPTLEQQAAEIN